MNGHSHTVGFDFEIIKSTLFSF